jgi:DNA phosphorothioation-associated putative methyltransferase
MNFVTYKNHIKQLTHGKALPTAVYLHKTALSEALPNELYDFISSTIENLRITDDWNILKLYKRDFKIALLNYPEFDTYAYPALNQSITIDIEEQTYRTTNYSNSDNPPILHRKETFVLASYPHLQTFKQITEEGEAIELYKNTKTIGFKQQWQRLIKRKGFELDQFGRLKKLNFIQGKPEEIKEDVKPQQITIKRHLTAINRDRLSAPFQKLAKYGYLNGEHSILDYGCGLGDDLTELEAHGLNINGWDPVHKAEGNKTKSDIVNLGFVLNVIEDQTERSDTLKQAFDHSNKLLIVSVMLTNESKQEQYKPYKDGVITKWQTFQKYYSQTQIREYIEATLNTKTVTFGQGIIAIFKNNQFEELFYLEQQYQNNNWQHLTVRPKAKQYTPKEQKSIFDKNQTLCEDFWQHALHFGRIPANDEFEQSQQIRSLFGSHNKAFIAISDYFETEQYDQAIQKRTNDLLVYFALSLFAKRQAKSNMPSRLTRDIKAQFDSYNQCLDQAQNLLFSVGKTQTIANACYQAYNQFNLGQLQDSHSYIFPQILLNSMPAVIRLYVGCAIQLYGDVDEIDLIKVHMRSGKVTLLKYDDFKKNLPLLTERIKIKLVDLDIDFFTYGDEYPLQPLYNKIDFIDKKLPDYKKQQSFDKKISDMLKGIEKHDWPNWEILQKVFEYKKVTLKGDRFYSIL